jgi:polyferredoxin
MKLRKGLAFLSFFLLPITINYFSPVLVVQGSFEKTFTAMHILYLIMLLGAIFFGGFWCSYICPFGALQDLLPGTLRKRKFKNVKWITGIIFLVLILAPIIIYGIQKIIIPYHMQDKLVSISSLRDLVRYYILTIGIILITVILGKRNWCRYVCPMYIFNYIGIKISKLLRLPGLKFEIKSENCTNCGICSKNCLMGLDVHQMVKNNNWNRNECIQCGQCINSCKCGVLKRKWCR